MPTITNHFTNVQMLKVDNTPGASGPLLVVQRGVAPGDMTVKDKMFLLCRDGSWVDVVQFGATLDAKVRGEAIFDNTAQVMQLLDSISAQVPAIKKLDVSASDIEAWLARTAGLDPMQRVRNILDTYRKNIEQRKP